jgi:hypothetical protein
VSLATWIACELAAIIYAFEYLRLDTLYCETLETNMAVLRLSDHIGFETTANHKTPFIEKRFTRECYQKKLMFARISTLEIDADPREQASS